LVFLFSSPSGKRSSGFSSGAGINWKNASIPRKLPSLVSFFLITPKPPLLIEGPFSALRPLPQFLSRLDKLSIVFSLYSP